MEAWKDFFVAEVGAAAAIAGLLIVAMSINISKILEHAVLPARAAQTMAVISGVLVLASLALFPHQSEQIFGSEAVVVAGSIGLIGIHQFIRAGSAAQGGSPRIWRLHPFLMTEAVAGLFFVGGVMLAVGYEPGLDVLAWGVIAGLVAVLASGWVLLIEILR